MEERPRRPDTLYVLGNFCRVSGHHLWSHDLHLAFDVPIAVARACDGTGIDPEPYRGEHAYQPEGGFVDRATRPHSARIPDGWSFVSWWDRRGDVRGNSHTGLLAKGVWTDAELVEAGQALTPWAFRVKLSSAGRRPTD